MTSSIVNPKKSNTPIIYPCLMKADIGMIVLMRSHNEGTVVNNEECSSKDHYRVGYSSSIWDIKCFTPFIGEVLLKN